MVSARVSNFLEALFGCFIEQHVKPFNLRVVQRADGFQAQHEALRPGAGLHALKQLSANSIAVSRRSDVLRM